MNRSIKLHFRDDQSQSSITNDRDLVENEVSVDGPWGDEVWEAEAEAEAAEAEAEAAEAEAEAEAAEADVAAEVEDLKQRLKAAAAAAERGPQPVFGRVTPRTGPRRIVALFETARDCARVSVDIAEAVGEVYSSLASSVEDRAKWSAHLRELHSRELSSAEAEAVEEASVARIRAEAARTEAAAAAAFSALGAFGGMALDATVRNADFRRAISAIPCVWARSVAEVGAAKSAERLARAQTRLTEAEAETHELKARAEARARELKARVNAKGGEEAK